jgi:hypothetical protein
MTVARDSVTKHEARAQIERDLALGVPLRRLAKKYGLSKDALFRHRKRLPAPLKQALLAQSLKPEVDLDQLRATEGEALLANLAAQRAKLLLWQDAASSAEQFQVAATISAQIHRNLELVGKYLGEFSQHYTTTTISVLISPQYLELRAALLKALAPHLAAKKAVAAVLHAIESSAAQPPPQRLLEDKRDAGTSRHAES